MAYDSSLDEKVFSKSWDGNGSRLIVGVYSYNKGAKKVQISRELMAEEGRSSFAKLGRLTREELEAILPLLREALNAM
jgi:hypothetical protein